MRSGSISAPKVATSGDRARHLTCPTSTTVTTLDLASMYLQAKRIVLDCGYAYEIRWQSVGPHKLTTQTFVSEAAWVVLSAGMSEAVVSRVFPKLQLLLADFDPEWIVSNATEARTAAMSVFGHRRKIEAILAIAALIHDLGVAGLQRRMQDPESFLIQLPYIGPVTWRHLAKNLGSSVAKADRHLMRFAKMVTRNSVDDLCAEISGWLDEPVAVVDIVLWRWSVLHSRICSLPCTGLTVMRQDSWQSV